ncbi:MAG: hypothetical protein WD176_02660, partial [Pirellulales bacterium]
MPTHELVLEGARHQLWSGVLIAAAVLAAVCLVLLYQYERKLVPRRLGLGLLSLRLAAAGVLVLALLEPQWSSSTSRKSSGRIVVAVDVSQSMDTADQSLSDAEALRLARALGMLGNAATAAQLDDWIAAFEQNREPDWVSPDEFADDTQAAVLADTRRANLKAIRSELAALPRTEIARRLLLSGRSTILDRLAALGTIDRQVFAGTNEPTTPDGFAESMVNPPESLSRAATDLSGPLKSDRDGDPPAAIVMLTDGLETSSRDTAPLVALAESVGVPIFPVLIGSQRRPQDIGVS